MYRCTDCGMEFSRPVFKDDTEYTVCPGCGGSNYGELRVCEVCGKHMADGDKEHMEIGGLTFCRSCVKRTQDTMFDLVSKMSDAEKVIAIDFMGG